MQWLIDIVLEAVAKVGYLTTGFVNRGDPAVPDWGEGDLIVDTDWHELDLSAIVPEGAKGVLFKALGRHAAFGKRFELRPHGHAQTQNICEIQTLVAGAFHHADWVCPCDGDRKIDYMLETPAWITVILTVKGWWF